MTATASAHFAGTWTIGDRSVSRFGYGAMQLAGPGVMGPPSDRDGALAVLREAVSSGVTHIDTSAAYGPHVTNELIRDALHPYDDDLVIATKVGANRTPDGGWPTARRPEDLRAQVLENLEDLAVDSLDLVYLRMGDAGGPQPGTVADAFGAMLEMQNEGLLRRIGLSNVTAEQVAEARALGDVSAVQNLYNLAMRGDDALIDQLATAGIAYVPFFPLGGFSPLQAEALSAVAGRVGTTPMVTALAWLLQRSPNVLLIAGTSKVAHLRENLTAASLVLSAEDVAELDAIAG